METEQLQQVLELHKKWLKDEPDGKRADLRGADLRGADLQGADLRGATYGEGVVIGNDPICIMGLKWFVLIMQTHIKIGCELHSKAEWAAFDDESIKKMNSGALEFWREHKEMILNSGKLKKSA